MRGSDAENISPPEFELDVKIERSDTEDENQKTSRRKKEKSNKLRRESRYKTPDSLPYLSNSSEKNSHSYLIDKRKKVAKKIQNRFSTPTQSQKFDHNKKSHSKSIEVHIKTHPKSKNLETENFSNWTQNYEPISTEAQEKLTSSSSSTCDSFPAQRQNIYQPRREILDPEEQSFENVAKNASEESHVDIIVTEKRDEKMSGERRKSEKTHFQTENKHHVSLEAEMIVFKQNYENNDQDEGYNFQGSQNQRESIVVEDDENQDSSSDSDIKMRKSIKKTEKIDVNNKKEESGANFVLNRDENEHVFPFHNTPSGNLKIERRLVSYESPKVAVLVSNPSKTKIRVRDEHQGEILRKSQKSEDRSYEKSEKKIKMRPILIERGYETEPPSRKTSGYGNFSIKKSETETPENFLQNVHYRLKKAINADTRVIIGENEFPCHGVALEAYSKYFDRLRRPRDKIFQVIIPEEIMSGSDFHSLMDWILISDTQKNCIITNSNVIGLFSASVYLHIPQLKSHCLSFLRSKINSGNSAILKLYAEARKKKTCGELLSILTVKLAGLFTKLSKSEEFYQMNISEMLVLLQSDNLEVKNELEVFEAGARWIFYDWEKRGENCYKIMSCVRFGLLSPLQLTQLKYSHNEKYERILRKADVGKLIDNGLSVAILRENFEGHPGELNRWLKNAGVEAPTERLTNFDHPSNISLSQEEDCNDSHFKCTHKKKEKKKKRTRSRSKSKNTKTENIDVSKLHEKNKSPKHSYVENSHQIEEKSEHHPKTSNPYQFPPDSQMVKNSQGSYLTPHSNSNSVHKAHLISSNSSLLNMNMPIFNLSSSPFQKLLIFGGHDPNRPFSPVSNPATSIYYYTPQNNETNETNYENNVKNDGWELGGHLPAPRTHSSAAVLNSTIYIIGGVDPRFVNLRSRPRATSSTWALDTRNWKWSEGGRLTEPRASSVCVVASGRIYLFGGVGEEGEVLKTCEVYEGEIGRWRRVRDMDRGRVCGSGAECEGRIWIVGGLTKQKEEPMLDSVIIYDIRKDVFYSGPTLPHPLAYSSFASYANRLLLIGGVSFDEDGENTQSLSEALVYENDERKWKIVPGLNLKKARHGQSSVQLGKHLILFGGVNSDTKQALNSIEIINVENLRVKNSNIPPLPRRLTGLAAISLP